MLGFIVDLCGHNNKLMTMMLLLLLDISQSWRSTKIVILNVAYGNEIMLNNNDNNDMHLAHGSLQDLVFITEQSS